MLNSICFDGVHIFWFSSQSICVLAATETVEEQSLYCTHVWLVVPGHGSRMYALHEDSDAQCSGA